MRVSPQKLNHLARLIRGMSLDEAEQQMAMILKKRGKDVKDLIVRVGHVLSHNYGKNKDDFIIKQAWVGKGVFLKRLWIHGRGRTGRMTRPTAHLKIMLGQKISQDSKSIELQKLVKQFKRHRLFVSLKDKQPIRPAYPIWSSKPWKYVTSPKWIESSNANVNKKI
jgi:mRNA deadenylase 3'-5' endonuclease subunit Ccr4